MIALESTKLDVAISFGLFVGRGRPWETLGAKHYYIRTISLGSPDLSRLKIYLGCVFCSYLRASVAMDLAGLCGGPDEKKTWPLSLINSTNQFF